MKKFINAFTALAVIFDESRHTNEDGSWNAYWAKKHCKAELRTLKAQYKADKTAIRNKWRTKK